MLKNYYWFLPIIFTAFVTSAHNPHAYTSSNTGIYCSPISKVKTPGTVKGLARLVKSIAQKGKSLKVIGSLHSNTDIICTDGFYITMEKFKGKRIHPDKSATFGAGLELEKAMEFLERNRRTLIMIPAFCGITIGGAIGTGAHGSSLIHPTSLSDQVIGMKVIIWNGTILRITTSAELNAWRIHLGLMGIVVSVRFNTVPLFKMTVENKHHSDSILFNNQIPKLASQTEVFQLWWFPSTSSVVISKGKYVKKETRGHAVTYLVPQAGDSFLPDGSLGVEEMQAAGNTTGLQLAELFLSRLLTSKVPGRRPIFTEDGVNGKNPATGYAWRLLCNNCVQSCRLSDGSGNTIAWEESSMAFDLSQFGSVMGMMRDVISKQPVAFMLKGVHIRFQKASEGLVSIATGRPTFTVEWITPMRLHRYDHAKDGIAVYQLMLQKMLMDFNGRPHWGKNGLAYTTHAALKITVPNRNDFIRKLNEYDPIGLFRNKFGKRILGISHKMDMHPLVSRCALQDYCICNSDPDCAEHQYCVTVETRFRICKNEPAVFP